MIIFDLDGTLADCEHRRHFVDERKNLIYREEDNNIDVRSGWKPDWQAFYEACDQDKPIEPVLSAFIHLTQGEPFNHDVQIWSGRCESVRDKTLNWLVNLTGYCGDKGYWDRRLKMRPIGDNTPDDQLKERWLNEAIAKGKLIDFVFDDRKKVRDMWIRRGIFVFDVSQGKGDF